MMKNWLKKNVLVVLLVASGVSGGTTAGVLATLALAPRSAQSPVVELPLYATASDSGKDFSIATGPIDDSMEGLFVLDFRTGNLTLDVINMRDTTKPNSHFKSNVVAALGVDKEKPASYLMATAQTNFIGGKVGAIEPARCVAYVMDQSTGRWVAYGLFWNPTLAKAGTPQAGELKAISAGTARPVELE